MDCFTVSNILCNIREMFEKLFVKGISQAIYHKKWLDDSVVENGACYGCRTFAGGQRDHACIMLGRTEWVTKCVKMFCEQILPFDVLKQRFCLRVMDDIAMESREYKELKGSDVLRYLGGEHLSDKLYVWSAVDWKSVADCVRKLERKRLVHMKESGELKDEMDHKYYDPADDEDDSVQSSVDDASSDVEAIIAWEEDFTFVDKKKARLDRSRNVKCALEQRKKRLEKLN